MARQPHGPSAEQGPLPQPADADDLLHVIERLKTNLIAFATDGTPDFGPDEYQRSRRVILGLGEHVVVPEFLRECRNVGEFWEYIKPKFPKYAERRLFIATELNRVLDQLEEHATLGMHLEQGEVIGEGGFGVVYRYRHTLLEMDFAVKVFAPAFSYRIP